jgi:hypothetical protein
MEDKYTFTVEDIYGKHFDQATPGWRFTPITVKDVYGKPFSELTAPGGYKFTGEFRLPKGDTCLGLDGSANCTSGLSKEPRLILKRIPPEPADLVWNQAITVKDIYGRPFSELTAPTGYKFTGEFEPVTKLGIVYLGASYAKPTALTAAPGDRGAPRLTLEKLPTRKRIIFEPTGEHRPAERGEWWASEGSLYCTGATVYPTDIYIRREEEY